MKLPSLLGCLALAFIAACSSKKTTPAKPVEALVGHDYFMAYVKPILETQCLRCHSGSRPPAGLSLVQSSDAHVARRRGKAFIVPGDPDASLLITAISRQGSHPLIMPRLEISLTDDQIGTLREWVEDGAFWPTAPDGFLRRRFNIEDPR